MRLPGSCGAPERVCRAIVAPRAVLYQADGGPRLRLVEGQRQLLGHLLCSAGPLMVLDTATIDLHVPQDGVRAPAPLEVDTDTSWAELELD